MPISYACFDLANGFVHHWLVAGPQAISISDPGSVSGSDLRVAIARHHYVPESGVTSLPVEPGPPGEGILKVGDYEGAWSYVRCREDHLAEHRAGLGTAHYLRSWAYVQLVSDALQPVTLRLATYGPADLWLNGNHIHRHEQFADACPRCHDLDVDLQEGANEVLVRFEQVALGHCRHAVALQVRGRPPCSSAPGVRVSVRLPTTIPDVDKRRRIERVLEAAYTDRDVYGRDDLVLVHWPQDLTLAADTAVRLQAASGRIYAEAHLRGAAGERATLRYPHEVPPGPYRLILMPRPDQYYEQHMRIRRELDIWALGDSAYAEAPHGAQAQRRQEALLHASRYEGSLFGEVARMALGRSSTVDAGTVLSAVRRVDRREEGSIRDLVALLGMLCRFGSDAGFPASLRQPLEECILGYRYRPEPPDQDARCGAGDGHGLLSAAAEILAGQQFPGCTFRAEGLSGRQLRERGERLALSCLRERSAHGFADWGSPCGLADDLVALSHLVDLAQSDEVYDMAGVIMDKTLLTLALNSHKGVLGAAHRACRAPEVFGGLLGPTAGATRLLWGQGVYNHHLSTTVSLACVREYELPAIVAEIALSPLEEEWSRERHLSRSAGAAQEVNRVTYRTPDYMLSSAQDYRPGERGRAEHIWQATLGPAAVVFANHPACATDDEAHRPGFWVGNQVLPRVAQWKDVLIAIHNLPEGDWMGFTHAYFPTCAFDEHVLREGWAFA
ncbi:MAG: hypothetical protein QME94_15405, partial [Anaerolineae bacterium]|nr:hypothetical protein [Anaerolineae bacterium]